MPHLAPAAYSNLALVQPRPARIGAADRKAEAQLARDRELETKQKVEQVNRVLDRHEARSAALAAQIKELQRRKAFVDQRAERIEDRVLTEMQAAGLDKLTGIRITLSARNAGVASLVIDDESLIPREYFREPKTPAPAPDKNAIKAALEAHAEIAAADWGCRLAQKVSLIRN